ncbi:hypothetical protein VTK26DRAFT_4477 [Humicola hyalothermophila]
MSQASRGQPAPGKFRELVTPKDINKRCDLPPEAYRPETYVQTPFALRPGYNGNGADIRVGVNQFFVKQFQDIDIFQFDITITPEPKGAIVYKKVWDCAPVQAELKKCKKPWLYDGRKLSWSTNPVQGFEMKVDLGEEEGRAGRENNQFTFKLKRTGKIRMEALKAYLSGKMAWDNSVLECMSFLDHALRQGPSETMLLIKRTFFNNHSQTKRLNSCTEAIKGIYSAIRLNSTIKNGGHGLGINVDISNQTFWVGQKFDQLARNYLSCLDRKWENLDYEGLRKVLQPVKVQVNGGAPTWGMSEAFKALRRLQNMRFRVTYRGGGSQEYKVRRIMFQATEQGANARAITFDKNENGQTVRTSVYDYYQDKYNMRLQHWHLPLIETTKSGYFPMEVCEVERFNSYTFKLDPAQTSEMIRFAVQRPQARKAEVMQAVQNLNWGGDEYLKTFGIKIDSSMPIIPAKLLPNPVIGFANRKTIDPKTFGRWDLRGQKFVAPNKRPLRSWAFVVVDKCVDKASLDNFIKNFRSIYTGHGGIIEKAPLTFNMGNVPHDQLVHNVYMNCGNTNKQTPQIIFFILGNKNAWVYDRLKKNAECRFALVTQMLQAPNVRKGQGQYISNVCMKVNAKLGGQTSSIANPQGAGFFKVPTMMIGVDVSHGPAGGTHERMSTAAMCVSMDKEAAIYSAAVETNGWAVEIVQPGNMHSMLGPLVVKWRKKFNTNPKHVFYVRDGVAEGQYAHVMEFELAAMKEVFKEVVGEVPKITVIIATKRHHVRFFPERGDKNGNCLPGTLVEHQVTHPFHYDFYLCSHVAIQGTARPVHYNVIHDECGLPVHELQRILYQQCYQYCRSTTPVSLHPAVYYAHLASARARHHESTAVTSVKIPDDYKHIVLKRPVGLMAKRDVRPDTATGSSDIRDTIPPPLMKPGSHGGRPDAVEAFNDCMWWV